jgi:hypothetical protein
VNLLGSRRPKHSSEASRIVIAQHGTVAELDVDVIVRSLGRSVQMYAQAARHSQMYD